MVKRNIRRALIKLIRFYQMLISPFFPSNCRFYPTCSQYAIEAIETHGCVTGLGKTLHRLSRCHPFSKQHGYDPVNKTKGNT